MSIKRMTVMRKVRKYFMSHLQLVSDNPSPVIASLHFRYTAFTDDEAERVHSSNPNAEIIRVGADNRPYRDIEKTLPCETRPTLKRFSSTPKHRLSVSNFSTDDVVLLNIDFRDAVEPDQHGQENLIIDPGKEKILTESIACIPLVQIFHDEISEQVGRTISAISRYRGENKVVSLTEKREQAVMRHALGKTFEVIRALHARDIEEHEQRVEKERKSRSQQSLQQETLEGLSAEAQEVAQPLFKNKEGLVASLQGHIDALPDFYESLWQETREAFDPVISTISERLAVNSFKRSQDLGFDVGIKL